MQIDTPTLDFVGIGAARSGTTWISKCLADHPEVFVPAKKELHYYNSREHMARTPLATYFADADDEDVYGEYTPRYIINRTALDHIANAHPDATIIVSLRDPVERALSQYKQKRYNLEVEDIDSFEAALTGPYREDYLTKGLYAYQFSTVFDIFDRDQIHLVFMKDIKDAPASVVERLYSSIGVDESFQPPALKERINESGPGAGNVLKTDLQSNEVVIRGRTIDTFDRIQRIGAAAFRKLPAGRAIRPAASTAFQTVRNKLEASVASVESTDTNRTAGDPTVTDETKRRVYRTYFADEVAKLETMIDEDLSRWKR
jgi:hypothetical protein